MGDRKEVTMARKGSQARQKKRLEKKRARRKEKVKEKHRKEHLPLTDMPLHETLMNPDWEETRYARILVSRRHPEGTYALCEFLVDLDGFGLRDCYAPKRVSAETLEQYVRREKRKRADAGLCSALVHGGVRWAHRFHFPLPKDTRKALDILPDQAEQAVEFGREGEPFLRGDEADIRARVRQSGHTLEEFDCDLFPAPSRERTYYFVTEEYLREGDRNDPLVRLERLATLADRYEATGEIEKAEELHATMEELAGESNKLPEFLKYLALFQDRQRRMDQAMQTRERIVAVTDDPQEKALARLDLADYSRFMGDALGADEIYRKVMEERPELLSVRLRYAAFLYEAARRDEAKESLRELIEELKTREENRDDLTRAYQELYTMLKADGDKSEAKALYKEAKKEQSIRLR
jgi:tetratricopeptide (TPR) repeat protein